MRPASSGWLLGRLALLLLAAREGRDAAAPSPPAPPWVPYTYPPPPPSPEAAALAELYFEFNGTRWPRQERWLRGDPCTDEWEGVSCCPSTAYSHTAGGGCKSPLGHTAGGCRSERH